MCCCRSRIITAISLMAVVFAALVASGCATKRDVEEIKDRLNRVEENSRQSQQMMTRMDSVIAAGAESNRMLQNDIRYSTDELTRQMSQLLENYNDLLTKIDQLSERQVIKLPPKSSPGAQADVPGDTSSGPPPSRQPAVDCIDTYDNAFTLVRRGEYKQAREGFRNFIADCETHSDIENAYYWIGECYYSEEEYTQAITEYEHLVNTYPDSPNIGRALYKLARCKQELGKKNEARELFERLVRDHAGTLEAEQAAQRLKDL